MDRGQFPRRVFQTTGAYGLVLQFPPYFTEMAMGQDSPPALTHQEYYGFIGATIAWAIPSLYISHDPVRWRPLMIPPIIEEFSLPPVIFILHAQQRVHTMVADAVFALLFAGAFDRTRTHSDNQAIRCTDSPSFHTHL